MIDYIKPNFMGLKVWNEAILIQLRRYAMIQDFLDHRGAICWGRVIGWTMLPEIVIMMYL